MSRREDSRDGLKIEWPAELAVAGGERHAAGESREAIANDLGLGQRRVYELLRERGLSRALSVVREERRKHPGYVHRAGSPAPASPFELPECRACNRLREHTLSA